MQPTRLALTVSALLAALSPLPALAQAQPQAPAQAQPQTKASQGAPAATGFVYQGVLRIDGQPVADALMASFRLYTDPEGTDAPIGPEIQELITPDDGGRFSVELDFGAVFGAGLRYLQITLLDSSNGPTPLSPRTKVTAAPLATYALSAPVPTLAQVTQGRLVNNDPQSNLVLSVEQSDAGLSIENQPDRTVYSLTGVTAEGAFDIESEQGDIALFVPQGNISMDAPTGRLDLTAGQQIKLQTTAQNRLDLSLAGVNLIATSIDIDSATTATVEGAILNLNADAILKLSSPIVQFTGGSILFGSHQISSNSVTLSGLLTVGGNAVKPGGGPWGALSDARQKKNITPLIGSLKTLLSLRPVRFEYNDPSNPLYVPGIQTGFVAQQVRPILPDWVDTASDGTLMLTPRGFEAMVVDALQELQARHEDEIDAMRRENKELRQRLDRIESLIGAGSR